MTVDTQWDPSRRYGCFINRSAKVVSIVSSALSETATGQAIGPLLVVCNGEGYVCDLEIRIDGEPPSSSSVLHDLPPPAKRAVEPIAARLGDVEVPTLGIDSEWLALRMSETLSGDWYQLGEESIYLLVGDGLLRALAVQRAIEDPEGKHESAWLDQVEGVERPMYPEVPVEGVGLPG